VTGVHSMRESKPCDEHPRPAQADAFDEMGADLPLSQMYAGGAAAGVAAEGIEPAAKKKKKQAGGGASVLTGDDASLAGLTDTAEFLSQETTMLITTEEAVGEEVEEGLDRRIKPRAASSLPLVFGDKVLRSKVLFYCFCFRSSPHISLMTLSRICIPCWISQ
jgi:hypothetical protein